MILPVVKYGDPVLRRRGAAIASITPEIEAFAADLLETMRAAHGVGLAAQQVGRAVQMAVVDVRGVSDRPSQLWLDGNPADVAAFMPVVLVNPQWSAVGPRVRGPEGCLSFPEIFADIERASEIDVTALNLRGEPYTFRAGGLLARAIQHEADHLNGVLFIDRMDSADRRSAQPDIDALAAETKAALARGSAG